MRCFVLLATLVAAPASAQSVTPCTTEADARHIVEPWEDHIRSFANGAVRIAMLDSGDLSAGSLRVLVLTPPYDGPDGARYCHLIGWTEEVGFATLRFGSMIPTYDPSTGLSLAVPARFYDPDLDISNAGLLQITVNQATGEVIADFVVTTGD